MAPWQFEAIGTAWQVDTPEPIVVDVMAEVLDRIERFDQAWSRFRADSLVCDIARSPGAWAMPEEADHLLTFYDELHGLTDGGVNPLIGRTLADLGYDASYSLVASTSPAGVPAWDTISWDPPTLTTIEPVVLDVGAAGKGLLVDLVSSILGRGLEQFTVNASGDIYHRGTSALRVALEDPRDPAMAIGVAELQADVALCASATNRRAWGEGLHHVLDARTGRPTHDVVATWVVVAQSCMLADGLATAHFLAEPSVLMGRFEHEFVRMYADGRLEWSPSFPGEVFA
ncbi:FAD:protein FMN transferase [Aeromicrobium sp. A1-2]|uniref:FAD:protein FMN transferase n=1 Tax=Aeromicrobium sp. A1-2 TaxID=2107713 RepID=UPI000E544220|nr:FAD:protein FMN transferase [Aeromicrobium sp. A1-2]AXT83777.1 FAD:protein FMN transferase [Aeromicrobium sp. A1-2]